MEWKKLDDDTFVIEKTVRIREVSLSALKNKLNILKEELGTIDTLGEIKDYVEDATDKSELMMKFSEYLHKDELKSDVANLEELIAELEEL